jgi:hypothetical protein
VDSCNRAQFVALAASMMRRILVNYARKRNAAKRDGDAAPLLVDTAARFGAMLSIDMVDLSRALDRLGELDQQTGANRRTALFRRPLD